MMARPDSILLGPAQPTSAHLCEKRSNGVNRAYAHVQGLRYIDGLAPKPCD